jgi:homoserine O-acetyltransferase
MGRSILILSGVLASWLLLSVVGTALAADSCSDGGKYFESSAFEIKTSAGIVKTTLYYTTRGTLNASRSNAVLLLPGTSGDRTSMNDLIGSGNAFDPDKHFIITPDPLGGGCSVSPAVTTRHEFPTYHVRDMVRTEIDLVRKEFKVDRLLAVAGISQGAFQTLQLGVDEPSFAKALILIVPSSNCDATCRTYVAEMQAKVFADPKWQGGSYTESPKQGLFDAGKYYFPWLYTDAYAAKAGEKAAEVLGQKWADNWDAKSLVLRYEAARTFDIGRDYDGDRMKAMKRVTAKVLLMRSISDRLLTYQGETDDLLKGLRQAKVRDIPSKEFGHMACCQGAASDENKFIRNGIIEFLKDVPLD